MSEAHDPGEVRASASEGAAKLPGASLSLKIALGLAPLGALIVAMFFWPDADFAIRRFGQKAPSAYVGGDFVNMYMGARAALEGDVGRLFDAARYGAALHSLHPELDFHAWSYPPHMLLFVTPFGLASYGVALALWEAVTFALFLWSVWPDRAESGSRMMLLAGLALMPVSLINVAGGQNGFLVAALLIGGVRLMDVRPWLAGALFGALTIKPHLGLVVPLFLVARGAWETIASAIATTLTLVAATAALFGVEVWSKMLEVTLPHQTQLLESGRGLFLAMIPSPYMALRFLGAPHRFAMAAHIVVALGVAVWLAYLLRRDWTWRRRGLAVALAASLVSPYFFNYDMVASSGLALAALWAERDERQGKIMALAAAVTIATPAVCMLIGLQGIAVGPYMSFFVLWLLSRERDDAGLVSARSN